MQEQMAYFMGDVPADAVARTTCESSYQWIGVVTFHMPCAESIVLFSYHWQRKDHHSVSLHRRREIWDRTAWEEERFPETTRGLPWVQSDAAFNSDLQYLKLLAHSSVRLVKNVCARHDPVPVGGLESQPSPELHIVDGPVRSALKEVGGKSGVLRYR